MAEAEASGNPLSYDTIEAIIENDTVSADSKASEQPKDIAMGLWGGGKHKGGRGGWKDQKKGGRGSGWPSGKGWPSGNGNWSSGYGKDWNTRPAPSSSTYKGDKDGKKGKKGFGKGKPDSASSVNETKIALQRAQKAYNDAKEWSSGDQAYWTTDYDESYFTEYPRQQYYTAPDEWEMYGPAEYTDYDHEPESTEYSGNDDGMNMAVEAADRANPPRMGRIATTFLSKKLSAATSLKECCY